MSDSELTFTRHAETMLVERGIERAWVVRTVREPEEVEPDPLRANVFRAFRSVPERDGRVLRVVYSVTENEVRIVTAFLDRARRGR